jgi:hypothetical protein
MDMEFLVGGICYMGVGGNDRSLKLSFGLTVILAVPLVVLTVYGLVRIPTEASAVENFHGIIG